MNLIHRAKSLKLLANELFADLRSPVKSYAQHNEDVVIEGLLGQVESFVDIGANDGISFSNTRRFSRLGAEGVCFEPEKTNYRRCWLFNAFFPKVRVVCGAVGASHSRGRVHSMGYKGLLSSVTPSACDVGRSSAVVIIDSLNNWLTRLKRKKSVDIISIDVEGSELEVLRGIDFDEFEAKAWVIETDKVSVDEVNSFLKPAGYFPVLSNGLNTIWLKDGDVSSERIERVRRTAHDHAEWTLLV
jgi:FkbM family methyltransferase